MASRCGCCFDDVGQAPGGGHAGATDLHIMQAGAASIHDDTRFPATCSVRGHAGGHQIKRGSNWTALCVRVCVSESTHGRMVVQSVVLIV